MPWVHLIGGLALVAGGGGLGASAAWLFGGEPEAGASAGALTVAIALLLWTVYALIVVAVLRVRRIPLTKYSSHHER